MVQALAEQAAKHDAPSSDYSKTKITHLADRH
jgi:hypothetical protein